VQNLAYVKRSESSNDLDEYIPDFLFFNVSFPLLISANFLVNVSIIGIFHYEAQALSGIVDEGLLVTYHVGFVDRGKDTNLIQSVLPLFLC